MANDMEDELDVEGVDEDGSSSLNVGIDPSELPSGSTQFPAELSQHPSWLTFGDQFKAHVQDSLIPDDIDESSRLLINKMLQEEHAYLQRHDIRNHNKGSKTSVSPSKNAKPASYKQRWTDQEKATFRKGLEQLGHNWKDIASLIQTRTYQQVKSFAQSFLLKKSSQDFHTRIVHETPDQNEVVMETDISSNSDRENNLKEQGEEDNDIEVEIDVEDDTESEGIESGCPQSAQLFGDVLKIDSESSTQEQQGCNASHPKKPLTEPKPEMEPNPDEEVNRESDTSSDDRDALIICLSKNGKGMTKMGKRGRPPRARNLKRRRKKMDSKDDLINNVTNDERDITKSERTANNPVRNVAVSSSMSGCNVSTLSGSDCSDISGSNPNTASDNSSVTSATSSCAPSRASQVSPPKDSPVPGVHGIPGATPVWALPGYYDHDYAAVPGGLKDVRHFYTMKSDEETMSDCKEVDDIHSNITNFVLNISTTFKSSKGKTKCIERVLMSSDGQASTVKNDTASPTSDLTTSPTKSSQTDSRPTSESNFSGSSRTSFRIEKGSDVGSKLPSREEEAESNQANCSLPEQGTNSKSDKNNSTLGLNKEIDVDDGIRDGVGTKEQPACLPFDRTTGRPAAFSNNRFESTSDSINSNINNGTVCQGQMKSNKNGDGSDKSESIYSRQFTVEPSSLGPCRSHVQSNFAEFKSYQNENCRLDADRSSTSRRTEERGELRKENESKGRSEKEIKEELEHKEMEEEDSGEKDGQHDGRNAKGKNENELKEINMEVKENDDEVEDEKSEEKKEKDIGEEWEENDNVKDGEKRKGKDKNEVEEQLEDENDSIGDLKAARHRTKEKYKEEVQKKQKEEVEEEGVERCSAKDKMLVVKQGKDDKFKEGKVDEKEEKKQETEQEEGKEKMDENDSEDTKESGNHGTIKEEPTEQVEEAEEEDGIEDEKEELGNAGPEEEIVLDASVVTEEEKIALPDFFDYKSAAKTPERYLHLRNHIIKCWQKCKPGYLYKSAVRAGLGNAGDVNCISRIHAHLESTGAINFGACNRPRGIRVRRTKKEIIQALQEGEPKEKRPKREIKPRKVEDKIVSTSVKLSKEKPKRFKPRQPRNHVYDPFKLVECRSFSKQRPAPFDVKVKSDVITSMDLHAHLSTTEVIGLLGGQFDAENSVLDVRLARPCRSLSTGMQCEMDPVSQTEACEEIISAGCSVVGWYHSHPTFAPNPSIRDIETQQNFQEWFSQDTNTPFIGVIVSPYQNTQNAVSKINYLTISKEWSQEIHSWRPYKFDVSVYKDGTVKKSHQNVTDLASELIAEFSQYK